MSWTDEKVLKLKELWGKGKAANQIAEIIGGISRNAVIGKAHRLNLSAKIKTRTATSNKNFENSLEEKNLKSKRNRSATFICSFFYAEKSTIPVRGENADTLVCLRKM